MMLKLKTDLALSTALLLMATGAVSAGSFDKTQTEDLHLVTYGWDTSRLSINEDDSVYPGQWRVSNLQVSITLDDRVGDGSDAYMFFGKFNTDFEGGPTESLC